MVQQEQNEPHIHSDNSSDEEEEEEEEEDDGASHESGPVVIETLVAGRAKRAGAGNKYQSLLAVELEKAAEEGVGEDDLTLLFEEDEEDIEFEIQPVSDAEDVVSSDDEDRGPTTAEDELEGEEALQKEERSKRRLEKRKADKAFAQPTARRKKVKIDESATTGDNTPRTTAERPRKKSERVSWIPTGSEAPVRASSRTLAVQNAQRTLASMQQSEEKRIKQIAVMEEAQKRKEAVKAKPWTQAQQLAEAAKTERLNSKSLNKWEEAEKDRAEKQRLRLEALQNRKLEGPVIRWYSGPAEWVDDKLVHVGKRVKIEEVTDTKKEGEEQEDDKEESDDQETITIAPMAAPRIVVEEVKEDDSSKAENNQTIDASSQQPAVEAVQKHVGNDTKGLSGLLEGIQDYAALPEVSATSDEVDICQIKEATDSPPNVNKDQSKPTLDLSTAESPTIIESAEPTSKAADHNQPLQPEAALAPPLTNHPQPRLDPPTPTSLPPPTTALIPTPPVPTFSTRNLIHLLNFDPSATRDKDILRRLLFTWGPPPTHTSHTNTTGGTHAVQRKSVNHAPSAYNPSKPIQPICVITNQPAKYLDPLTGLPYAGIDAFRALRRVVGVGKEVEGLGKEGPVWSSLVGAWVGGGGVRAAKGVPEGFLGGVARRDGVKVEMEVEVEVPALEGGCVDVGGK